MEGAGPNFHVDIHANNCLKREQHQWALLWRLEFALLDLLRPELHEAPCLHKEGGHVVEAQSTFRLPFNYMMYDFGIPGLFGSCTIEIDYPSPGRVSFMDCMILDP